MATNPIFSDVPEWPERNGNPAPIGHNLPPLEERIPAEFREALLREKPDFLTKYHDLIGAADRAKAEDEATLGRCGDLVNAYRLCEKHINATHAAEKAPHLQAGRLVDGEKNALMEPLLEAKRKVEGIGNAFVAKLEAERRAEQARIEAEQRAAAEAAAKAEREAREAEAAAERAALSDASEAERQEAAERAAQAQREAEEAMAAAALAPAATAKAEPIRSDAGATISGKQEWVCEVEDYKAAFRAVADDPKVRAEIDAAVKRLVRAGKREIKGVRIWPVAKANFR